MTGPDAVDGDVVLTVPGRPEYLRLARLAAADAGARAGLSVDDIDDLRIGVDELAHAIIGDSGVDADLSLRLTASAGMVQIEGSCAAGPGPFGIGDLSRTIVGAVVDEHEVFERDGARRFRLVKRERP